jgi:hypothetical protein
VWSDGTLWTSLTAGDDFLALAGLDDNGQLSVVRLTAQGKLLEAVRMPAPHAARSVIARAVDHELYLVFTGDEGRQLDQLLAGKLVTTQIASAAIAGPARASSGQAWIALDSVLQRLGGAAATLTPTLQESTISCLGRYGQLTYACTRDGIDSLDANGLGAPLFELSQLTAPSLAGLSPSVADACDLAWQDFRFDLLSYGITLADAEIGTAPEQVSSPNAAQLVDEGGSRATRNDGCNFVTQAPTSSPAPLLTGSLLGLLLRKARRTRNRSAR